MRRLAAALILVLLPGFAPAQGRATSQLPSPTGKFGVGRTVFDWTDRSREEVATPEAGDFRELLVYLFYPIEKQSRGHLAVYFPHLKEVEAFEERFGKDFFRQEYGATYPLLSTVRTHTVENAALSRRQRQYPVVLFSHGGGVPVLFYTAIIEDLVSHGYVVAAIEHSYDGDTVVFPDNHIIVQSGWDEDAKRTPQERAAFHSSRIQVGAQDDSFVFDQLERLDKGNLSRATSQFQGRLDMSRAGALGHSLGGKIAIAACQHDTRFTFCLNLDGGLDPGERYGPLTQPVLGMFGYRKSVRRPREPEGDFLQRSESMRTYIRGLEAQYAGAPSTSRLVLIDAPGFSHFSYYDFPTAQTEEPPWNATPEQWSRNTEIIRTLTVAAFSARLGSRPMQPLNALPVAHVPEAVLVTLGEWKQTNSSWRFERTGRTSE